VADAYCKKHFISFCPDLSVDCPYCRIAELESELTTSRKEWNSLLETAEARLDAVEADRDDARRVMKEACEANRVFVARLDAVKNCKTYICVFPDIGKIGPAYRQRDIWEATEQDDWRDVEQAIKEARDG
jgi:hypothetical protein